MIFGSVCSGIEAATVAWEPLGWKTAWLAEIEKFPSEVLAHHYPQTPNLGDMTKIAGMITNGDVVAPDVLVGGTPCQAFSVAGLRGGLSDARGQLTIEYVRLANAIDEKRRTTGAEPCIAVWENVPGVLSSKDNAFGCFLGALAGESSELQPPGRKWEDAGCVFGPQRAISWRVLDAQYFGLAQRRRRVFVIASARNGFDPAKVLFESEGVRRDTPPSRETGENTAKNIGAGVAFGGGNTGNALDFDSEVFVVHENESLVAFNANAQAAQLPTPNRNTTISDPLTCSQMAAVATASYVRRLTPVECERLQGFPDNYTAIPWRGKSAEDCPDGPRYKVLGNSMAVPVMRWIGERIVNNVIQ